MDNNFLEQPFDIYFNTNEIGLASTLYVYVYRLNFQNKSSLDEEGNMKMSRISSKKLFPQLKVREY